MGIPLSNNTLSCARVFVLTAIIIGGCHSGKDASPTHPTEMTLSADPMLTIGVSEGDPNYMFGGVVALAVQSNKILVADSRNIAIRVYSESGDYLSDLGRKGNGPGEFRYISDFATTDTTILVIDGLLRRVVIFSDSTGPPITRIFDQTPLEKQPIPVNVSGDKVMALTFGNAQLKNEGAIIQDTVSIYLYDSLGSYLQSLGEVASRPRWPLVHNGRTNFPFIPFTSNYLTALCRESAYFGAGDAFVYRFSIPENKLDTINIGLNSRTVTETDRLAYIADLLEANSDGNQQDRWRKFADEVPFPSDFPIYSNLLCADAGGFWLQSYPTTLDDSSSLYHFAGPFTSTGEINPAAELKIPKQFEPILFADDFVGGRWTDSLGIQTVRFYNIME